MSHTIVGVPAIGVHARGQVKIGWSDRVCRESIHSPVIPGRVAGKVEKRRPRVIRVELVSTANISPGVSQAFFFRIEDNLQDCQSPWKHQRKQHQTYVWDETASSANLNSD